MFSLRAMLGAFLTTIFSLCPRSSRTGRSRRSGSRAPTWAAAGALVCLGALAHGLGRGLGGAGRNWFMLSGLIGMGLGDLASFNALPVLGSRLSILMGQCLAVPIAIVAEWLWIGNPAFLRPIPLGHGHPRGVALALMPTPKHPARVRVRPIGFLWGFLAAAGQGLGAVVSRRAGEAALQAGESIDGITAAYQRTIGGLAITAAFFIVRALVQRRRARRPRHPPRRRGHLWILVNALLRGRHRRELLPVALATTPSGIVLPIVATTPLVIIPFSYLLEGERPAGRSIIGGAIAVAGAVALTLAR